MKPGDYIEINIGTNNEQKMIKIGKDTSEKERNDLVILSNSIEMSSLSLMTSSNIIRNMYSNTLPLKQDIK